jgi:hypothetical protein
MKSPLTRAACAGALAGFCAAVPATGQCIWQWSPAFFGGDISDGVVRAATVWDDGTGPALYVLGNFTTAGGTEARSIAKWDGTRWNTLGPGLSWTSPGGGGWALAGIRGQGPVSGLFEAGHYDSAGGVPATPIMRWDGGAWFQVPGSAGLSWGAMIGFDSDGPGPAPILLYAESRVWNGQVWSNSGLATVYRFHIFDEDGPGPGLPALFAGGASGVSRLDSGVWTPVGGPLQFPAYFTDWDEDGPGPLLPRLCVVTSGGVVFKLVGGAWVQVAPGTGSGPYAITSYDEDGPGPILPTLLLGHDRFISRLSGATWAPFAAQSHPAASFTYIAEFLPFDPPGPEPEVLLCAGFFQFTNGVFTSGVSKLTGTSFSPLTRSGRGLDGAGQAALTFDDDGPGPRPPAVFVGGNFSIAAEMPSPGIARWDGVAWSSLGAGLTGGLVNALAVWDHDGSGPSEPSLVAAGEFTQAGGMPADALARWDGQAWHTIGAGAGVTFLSARAVAVFDADGPGAPALYVGGTFSVGGGSPMEGLAAWNGTSWSQPSPLPWSSTTRVRALAVYDEDDGGPLLPVLIAGVSGDAGLYRWNGTAWSVVGDGVSGPLVAALAVIDDDGPGPLRPALFVGGRFSAAGPVAAMNIARWDGQAWSALADGLGDIWSEVDVIQVLDDNHGTGAPNIFAGGTVFSTALQGLATWRNGQQQWFGTAGQGVANVRGLAVLDDGAAQPALYVTGSFATAGASYYHVSNFTRYFCAGCYADCNLDTWLNVMDFVCFQGRFAAQEPYANCDGSPGPLPFNVNDFVCYLSRFAVGCP